MAEETVTISKDEYDRLVRDSKILATLYAGGVDNWEWYDDTMESFFEEEEE